MWKTLKCIVCVLILAVIFLGCKSIAPKVKGSIEIELLPPSPPTKAEGVSLLRCSYDF